MFMIMITNYTIANNINRNFYWYDKEEIARQELSKFKKYYNGTQVTCELYKMLKEK